MSGKLYRKDENQSSAIACPWSMREAVLIRIWEVVWTLFVRWLPKPFYRWHVLLLKVFGCKIRGHVFVAPTARIYAPWLLEMDEESCLASRCEVYNLGPVKIGKSVCVAQYVYVCNGTHDLSDPILPLVVGNIIMEDGVFIGAKAIIMPGLRLCQGSVIGAGSVLTKDTEPFGIYAGNPAKYIKKRIMSK